jgi:hypothetical protein
MNSAVTSHDYRLGLTSIHDTGFAVARVILDAEDLEAARHLRSLLSSSR